MNIYDRKVLFIRNRPRCNTIPCVISKSFRVETVKRIRSSRELCYMLLNIISKLLLLKSIYNIMVRNKINYNMKHNSGKPIE